MTVEMPPRGFDDQGLPRRDRAHITIAGHTMCIPHVELIIAGLATGPASRAAGATATPSIPSPRAPRQ